MTDDTLYRLRPPEWTQERKHKGNGDLYTLTTPFGTYAFKKFYDMEEVQVILTPPNFESINVKTSVARAMTTVEDHYFNLLTQCLIPHTPEENK